MLALSMLDVLGVTDSALLTVAAVSDTPPVPDGAALPDEARPSCLLSVVPSDAGDKVVAIGTTELAALDLTAVVVDTLDSLAAVLPELTDADDSDKAEAALAVDAILDADTAAADVAAGDRPDRALSMLGVLGVTDSALLTVAAVSDTPPVPDGTSVPDKGTID